MILFALYVQYRLPIFWLIKQCSGAGAARIRVILVETELCGSGSGSDASDGTNKGTGIENYTKWSSLFNFFRFKNVYKDYKNI
jgi:hypothetical protein